MVCSDTSKLANLLSGSASTDSTGLPLYPVRQAIGRRVVNVANSWRAGGYGCVRCNAGNTTVVRNWARVNQKWPRDSVPGRVSRSRTQLQWQNCERRVMRYVVQASEHNTMLRAKEPKKTVIEPRIAMPHAPP